MNLINKIKNKLSQISKKDDIDSLKILTAQTIVRENKNITFNNIQDAEFQVFSQWGEDGIIQYLINKIPIENKVFIEFGVEDYTEANTRFLLINDNWSGLVMDGSSRNIGVIKNSSQYWKYDLTAKDVFITKNNIDNILKEYIGKNNFDKEIGLLSVDIDGNDYYIWEVIESVEPIIVVCEYNSVFGSEHNITVPYDETFVRTKKHYSNLYFGASLQAFCKLAEAKGYEFVGVNKNRVNAFFVKKEYAKKYIPELISYPSSIHTKAKFRESRNQNGNLTFLNQKERFELIKTMPVVNLKTNNIVPIETLVTRD